MQILQPDRGLRLPLTVRDALLDLGVACNDAEGLMDIAAAMDRSAVTRHAHMQAHQETGHALTVADDISTIICLLHTQAIALTTRAATAYAVYATRVSIASARGAELPLPDPEPVLPSKMAADVTSFLPPVRFTTADREDESALRVCNNDIESHRENLMNVILGQLKGTDLTNYDEVMGSGRMLLERDLVAQFPITLHRYAAAVVWGLGQFAGVREPDPDDR
jgi:hypothetical protein